MTRPTPWRAVAAAGMALTLAGCAVAPTGPSVLVLPGAQKHSGQFQADLAACQQQAQAQVAPAVDAANNQAAATALVGTAIGAAIGALVGYGSYGGWGYYGNPAAQSAAWGAGAGLAYGGVVGGSGSQAANAGLQQRYDQAYAQCMVLRGNQLPGTASVRRSPPALLPPPPPSYVPPPPPGYGPPQRAPAVPPPGTPPPVGLVAPA
jgi:hypothetical protein